MNSLPQSLIAIAALGKPRGNKGELTSVLLTSKPGRFDGLREVYLLKAGQPRTMFPVERIWNHDGTYIFKFRGIDSINQAEAWRGADVCVPREERVPLPPGEFFHSDLIGCELRDAKSPKVFGKITDVQEIGHGGALLEVDRGKLLVPFVRAICVEIRPDLGYVAADLPEGLENLDA